MALFSSSFTSYLDENALAFNSLLYNKIMSVTAQNLPMAALAFGMGERASFLPDGSGRLSFPNLENVEGIEKEIQFSGRLRTPTILVDQHDEVSRQQNTYLKDTFASMKWPLTHCSLLETIAQSDIDKISGSAKKSQSYVDAIIDVISESWAEFLTDSVHSDNPSSRGRGGNNQSKQAIGSLAYIVDDATDYPFDRSDSGNSRFRSYVVSSTGALTLPIIALAQNNLNVVGAKSPLALCDTIVYSKVQQLVQNKITLQQYDPSMDKFGGVYVKYGATTFVLDQKTGGGAGTVMYFINPEDWTFVFKDMLMMNGSNALIPDPTTPAGWLLRTRCYVGVFCAKPWRQGKLLGIS